ncbi:MAG: hypothetical protein ACI85O_003848 [Saprospiraceae bacterium]|jgi:hypothetical protein
MGERVTFFGKSCKRGYKDLLEFCEENDALFKICAKEARVIKVCNAPSPGATSSKGKTISKKILKQLNKK